MNFHQLPEARRQAIHAESKRRAKAWTDPESGEVTPVSRRPHTSDVSLDQGGRNAGAHSGRDGPVVVGASAEFVTRGRGSDGPRQAWAPPSGQDGGSSSSSVPRSHRGAAGNPPLSALGDNGPSRRTPASPYDCPACRSRYETPHTSERPARLPVLLVPCGHTMCKACIREWTRQQESTEPTCPLCRRQFSGTAVNQAVVAMIPAANQREETASESTADVLAQASAAASSHMAPLPPTLRRHIVAHATDEQRAAHAEQSARTALSHHRLYQLRNEEAGLAAAEHADAASVSGCQHAVQRALATELDAVEAEIKRLELQRTVVLTQLGEVLQKREGCSVREHECIARHEALRAVADVHSANAMRHRSLVLQLVPSPDVEADLDAEMRRGRGGGGEGY
jgi:hypothetical protein